MTRLAVALVPLLALSGVAFAQGAPAPTPQPAAGQHLANMNAPRGYLNDRAGDRATTALNLLSAKGYGVFTHFHADGRMYQATVSQGGNQFQVTVNPDSGTVSRG
jgi:hypothetical protein